MYRDENKQIGYISYNHLNLPVEILFENGSTIHYLYNAAGQKLRKTVNDLNAGGFSTTEYLYGYQYNNFILQFFSHPEGYVLNTPDKNGDPSYDYVYQYKDHLGNIRMNFVYAKGENGFHLRILEENHYYPFGLKHEHYNVERKRVSWEPTMSIVGPVQTIIKEKRVRQTNNSGYQYKYNGKEWQDELGLNTIAMDFRQYDPAIGRFNGMDRLTELVPGMSPYRFGFNNPVYWSDPSGLFENNGDNKIKGWVNTGKSVFWDPDVNNQEEIDKKYEGKGYVYVPDYEEIVDANGNTRQLHPDGTAAYVLDDVEVVATRRAQSSDDSEFDMFLNRYFQTYGLLLSSGGEYGRRWHERGNYTQTNGNQGNFKDRPYKRLSNNAKTNYNKALDLKKLSKAGTIFTVGSIAYDVLDDGNIKSSTVVNAAILTVTLLFPPTAILAVGYGVADYFFDFSGKIDGNFGEIKTGLYD